MATGTLWQAGGIASPSDVPYAGVDEWARMTGVSAMSPLVGGPGTPGAAMSGLPATVGEKGSRIVSNGTSGTPGDVGGPGASLLEDWRDVFNFRGSPIPWLLLFTLVMLGLMQLRVSARAGKARGDIALG